MLTALQKAMLLRQLWMDTLQEKVMSCAGLMAPHLISGQTDYYITVLQSLVNQFTTQVLTFDPPTHQDTNLVYILTMC